MAYTSALLDYFILATYIAQIIQLCFFPVPSAGSSLEMLLRVKKNSLGAKNHPAKSILQSVPKMIIMITATLIVVTTTMIPLTTLLFPRVNNYLLALIDKPSISLALISVFLLTIGNAVTFVAVGTLRVHVSFHEFGETTKLHTAGIYHCLRNPITIGLATIFAGFVLARPSGLMLIGFIVFLINSNYRIRMEEVYLEKTFGEEYLLYKDNVGKYFPKFQQRK